MCHMTEKIQTLVEEAESKLLEGDVFSAECIFKEVARLRSSSLAEQASSSGTSSSRKRNHKVNDSATGVVSNSATLSSQQASNDTEPAASPSNVSVSCGSTSATAATTPLAPPIPGFGSSTSTVTPNTSVTENSSAATAAPIPTPGGRRVPVPGARLFRNALLGARVPAVSNRSRANISTGSRSNPIPVVAGMNDSGTLDGKVSLSCNSGHSCSSDLHHVDGAPTVSGVTKSSTRTGAPLGTNGGRSLSGSTEFLVRLQGSDSINTCSKVEGSTNATLHVENVSGDDVHLVQDATVKRAVGLGSIIPVSSTPPPVVSACDQDPQRPSPLLRLTQKAGLKTDIDENASAAVLESPSAETSSLHAVHQLSDMTSGLASYSSLSLNVVRPPPSSQQAHHQDTIELNVHQESLAAATAASSFELGEAIGKRMDSSTISMADHYVCNHESVAEAAGTEAADSSSCHVEESGVAVVAEAAAGTEAADSSSCHVEESGVAEAAGTEAAADSSSCHVVESVRVAECGSLYKGLYKGGINAGNLLAEGGEGQEEWEASWTEGLGWLMQQQQQDAVSSQREGGIMADVKGSLMNGIDGSCTAASMKRALAGSTFGAHQHLLLDHQHQHLVMTSGTRGNGGGGGSSSVDGTEEDEEPAGGSGNRRRSSAASAVAAARRERLAEPASHVVEVYGMNPDVKTMHIEMFLDSAWLLCGEGKVPPVIRWVDDNHALLVCPDASTARNLLELDQRKFLLRPHDQASQAARDHPAIELLAPRERPKTTAAVAKRVLSHALGIPQLRDKTAEADLAKQRRAVKDEKQRKERARDEVWE